MLSFCDLCEHTWIVNGVCNPLTELIKPNVELLDDFDRICRRVGDCLVGDYDEKVEKDLFDLLLFVEPGLY